MYRNAILGFIIGDAMGMPVEFKSRYTLMHDPITKMTDNDYDDIPKGAWTDDTAMTLATMDSITQTGTIDKFDLIERFTEWIKNGKYTASNKVFDIGLSTARAIAKYELEKNPDTCGGLEYNDNGNGSLMRMLPVAYYCYINKLNDDEIIQAVRDASKVTHAHDVSIMGCYIYVRYIIFLLTHKDKYASYNMIKCLDYSMFNEIARNEYNRLLTENIQNIDIDNIDSGGYVKSTLESVIWTILNCENFKQSIIGAISLGGDTDTIAAITGSIAGIIYNEVPEEWLNEIYNLDYALEFIDKFEEKMNS